MLLLGGVAGTRKYAGTLDEVRVWNVARSQSEIQRDMGRRLAGTEPNLVAYLAKP